MRVVVSLFGAVALVLVATAIEHRLLWGYWRERPSVAPALEGSRAAASSIVEGFDPGSTMPVVDRNRLIEGFLALCDVPRNECLEGRFAKALAIDSEQLAAMPQVPVQDLSLILAWLRDSGWDLDVSPHETTVIESGGPDGPAWVVAARSVVGNDRYHYSEWLLESLDGRFSGAANARFQFEIAGIEFLTWPVLLSLNAVGGALVVAAAWVSWASVSCARGRA
jgi:hypothetical protein